MEITRQLVVGQYGSGALHVAQLHPRCHVMNESDGTAWRLFALQIGVLFCSRYCLETVGQHFHWSQSVWLRSELRSEPLLSVCGVSVKLSLWQLAETYGLSPTHYSPYVSAEALSFLQKERGWSLAFASEKYSEVHSQLLAIWKHLCL